MSGTGYASVGHLFEITEEKSSLNYKSILGKLVGQVYVNFDGSIVSRVGLAGFETFFSEVEISVENGSKYLSGILKLPSTDNFSFELEIERLAWSVIKSDHEFYLPHSKDKNNEEQLCFQLFCIFNRFCETTTIPMQLENNAKIFLFKKFGFPHSNDENKRKLKFRQFYEQVCKRKDGFVLVHVKISYVYVELNN